MRHPTPTPCPHASPRMIVAGILDCGDCEQTPPAEFVKDDTRRQEAALAAAWTGLRDAFDNASIASAQGARGCARKRPTFDESRWRAAVRDTNDAITAVEIAQYDLSTVKGADG